MSPVFGMTRNLGGGALWDVGSYTVSAVLEIIPRSDDAQVLFAEVCNEGKITGRRKRTSAFTFFKVVQLHIWNGE